MHKIRNNNSYLIVLILLILGVFHLTLSRNGSRSVEFTTAIDSLKSRFEYEAASSIRRKSHWEPRLFFNEDTQLKICNAISQRNYELLSELIAETTDLNYQQIDGFSTLHWAYIENDLTAFRMLLSAGATPDLVFQRDVFGSSYSFRRGSTLLFDSLEHFSYGQPFFDEAVQFLKYPDLKHPVSGGTVLHSYLAACAHPYVNRVLDIPIIETLIDRVDVNLQDHLGNDVAKDAAIYGFWEVCLKALEVGACPNSLNLDGMALRDIIQTAKHDFKGKTDEQIVDPGIAQIEAWLDANQDRYADCENQLASPQAQTP